MDIEMIRRKEQEVWALHARYRQGKISPQEYVDQATRIYDLTAGSRVKLVHETPKTYSSTHQAPSPINIERTVY